jgi:hypothetical protein
MAKHKTSAGEPAVEPDAPAPDLEARPARGRAKDKVRVHDPVGEAWHREASARWASAVEARPDQPIEAYDPLPLPDFNDGKPTHVQRHLMGRFLQDRDTGLVHDCHVATEVCAVDAIKNGTFYHFWSEVQIDPALDIPCPNCIP